MATHGKARVLVAPTGVVHAHISPGAMYNLEEMQALTKSILGKLGCPACHSGIQIIFQQEEIEFAV